MYSVQNPAGRLVVTRMPEAPTLEEAKSFRTELARVMMTLSKARVLLCSDFRAHSLYEREVTDYFEAMMRHDNLLLERCAIVVEPNTTGFQIFNSVRSVNARDKRIASTNPLEAYRYLAERATRPECLALAHHLGVDP